MDCEYFIVVHCICPAKSKSDALNGPDVVKIVEEVAENFGDSRGIWSRASKRVMAEAGKDVIGEKFVDQVIEIIKAKGHVAD